MPRGPTAQVWVRPASRRALETLRRHLESVEMEAHGEAERLSLATVDYLLRALEGFAPWPTDPEDLERLPFLIRATGRISPETAEFFQRRFDARQAQPPFRESAQEAA